MNQFKKIYVSPINDNIVKAVELVDPYANNIGFIISQRQHSYDGGYVDKELIYSLSRKKYWIERDHFCLNDFDKKTIEYDSSFFNLIHIDPWHLSSFNLNNVEQWIKYFLENNDKILFEFGTEDFIESLDVNDYIFCLEKLHKFNDNIKYVVSQGGSVVFDLKNIQPIDVNKTKTFIDLIHKNGYYAKRHNCDFHTDDELKLLSDLGIDAFNYAPEFTFISNQIIYNKLSSSDILTVNNEIIKKAPWHRWVNNTQDVKKNILSCLHYVEYLPEIQKHSEVLKQEIIQEIAFRLNQIIKIVF